MIVTRTDAGYTIESNGLMGNFLVRDAAGKIQISGLTYAGAESWISRALVQAAFDDGEDDDLDDDDDDDDDEDEDDEDTEDEDALDLQ